MNEQPDPEQVATDAVLEALKPLVGERVDNTLFSEVLAALDPVLEEIAARIAREPWMEIVPVDPEPNDLADQVLRFKLVLKPGAPTHVRENFQRLMAAQQPQEETDA